MKSGSHGHKKASDIEWQCFASQEKSGFCEGKTDPHKDTNKEEKVFRREKNSRIGKVIRVRRVSQPDAKKSIGYSWELKSRNPRLPRRNPIICN